MPATTTPAATPAATPVTAPAAAGRPDGRGQRPLGYWLRHVDDALEQSMARLFAADALSRRDWQVLDTLSRGPADTAALDAALAPFLRPEEASVRPHLEGLAARGWVVLDPDGSAALTERGRAANRRAAAQAAGLRERLTACLTPQELTTLMTLLERLAGHPDTLTEER
ncbi:hypothetical protein AB0F71_13690 [Kitasatospora sp. NPDC028055]|uniref:hypothetical protein n=1 Tax=Kitasatospora sp. NPDC028055 TaxID=3155653 RepID=UPI0033C91C7E